MSSLIFFIFMIWFIMRIVKTNRRLQGRTIRNKHRAAIHLALLQPAREALIPQRPAEQKIRL